MLTLTLLTTVPPTSYLFQSMSLSSVAPSVPAKDGPDPHVDYVLVFQGVPAKLLKSKQKTPESERSKIASEYEKLISLIHSVGLQTTTREGKLGSGQILIFVRTPNEVLIQCGKREMLFDYMHDVKSPVEPASTSSMSRSSSMGKGAVSSQAQTYSSAQRARFTYDLLTLPKPRGVGIILGSGQFPNLKDMTPLHDPEYNQNWLKRWSKVSSALQISNSE